MAANSSANELLRKVRKIEIRTRALSHQIFAGEYHSAFKGRGMAFSEVREYQYGDDVRSMDWNVTARLRSPYVKVFEEEREMTVVLLIDISRSGLFGTSERTKRDLIAEIAAVLSELNDPTVCTMCDMVASYVQDETAAEFYQCTGSAMVHLHIADSDGRSEAHILPGDGTLPLRSELEALRQAGYDGTATIELVSMYTDDPTYYARCAIERTRELL